MTHPDGAPSSHAPVDPRVLAVVFVGGVVGGLARYGITRAWPTPGDGFPWATFAVNTSGALVLALLLVVLAERRPGHRYLRPLLGTGVLGAFTTFSSVVVSTDRLLAHGHGRTAVGYLLGSLLAGLTATWLGLRLARSSAVRPRRSPGPAS